MDQLAPSHLDVPSGSHVPLDYESGEVPVLAVRLQQMFGATDTPSIAGGKVQVTRDLKSFWANGYRAVKADLKGQYPRHYWPDDLQLQSESAGCALRLNVGPPGAAVLRLLS